MTLKWTNALAAALLITASASAAEFYNVTDNSMGHYQGFWNAKNGAEGRLVAQIRPISNNRYEGFVLLMRAKSPVAAFTLQPAELQQGQLSFAGAAVGRDSQGDLLGHTEAKCILKDGKLSGSFHGDLGEGTLEASQTERISPTMGAKPPKHATVLFDGKSATGWENFNWKITPDGAIQVGKGDIRASGKMSSFRLHLEFRTPYMPVATGQERGNSGVYLQGKYEVQVLDSFGLNPLQDNDCGALYKVRAPHLNACLPPMTWQTYDIIFVRGNSARGELPNVTVEQNGIRVLDHVTIPKSLLESGTGGGDDGGEFLKLQDHGNPVQYRNIWAIPVYSQASKR
jgi:hypothetical protein